jgi:undecaprenyl-diphosphatase
VLVAALFFIGTAFLAIQQSVPAFDAAVRGAVHSTASPLLTASMKGITLLGAGWFLWPAGALVAVWLVVAGRRRDTTLFVATVLGSFIIEQGLKFLFHRIRPAAYFGEAQPSTYSFPSGHALVSLCFYLTLAELAIKPGWPARQRTVVWIAAAITVGLIGFSRVYLGVHYPTDVLGGYAAGIAWLAVVHAMNRSHRFVN